MWIGLSETLMDFSGTLATHTDIGECLSDDNHCLSSRFSCVFKMI